MPQQKEQIPLKIVGGTKFGRYPKISQEQTWNMLVSDNALVDYAGYINRASIAPGLKGRGLYSSTIANKMFAVIGNVVYSIDKNLAKTFIGTIATSSGDIFIAENNKSQIAITDKVNIYVYNYLDFTFQTVTGLSLTAIFGFDVSPGHISFQNGRFILSCLGTTSWILSAFNDGTMWVNAANNVGSLQTKPDTVQAVIPFPGKGNLIFVFGSSVVEPWIDVGAALFPYQKNTSFNIDYGCLNAASIDALGDYIVWLGANEQSGPVIMLSDGNTLKEISTDGIDFKFSLLKNPNDCSGFFMKLDGHLIYQFTFKTDNLSYIYDFTSQQFFNVSDENLNYHVARRVVFFNNKYYFVSFNDGNLYEFGTEYTNYQYDINNVKQIPRFRIPPPLRFQDQTYRIINSLSFTVENGQPNQITKKIFGNNQHLIITAEDNTWITSEDGHPIGADQSTYLTEIDIASEAIDLSISRDGGETFNNQIRQNMNPSGVRKSRLIFQRLGIANDTTAMIQFWGFGRFVAFDGIVEVYR